MNKLFVSIYDYFAKRKTLRNVWMIGSFLLMLFFALQLKFEEEFTRFFPDDNDSENSELVFQNLKIKDKIFVMISAKDTLQKEKQLDSIVVVSDLIRQRIAEGVAKNYILNVFSGVEEQSISRTSAFFYDYLPVFLTDEDYRRMDSLTTPEAIHNRLVQNFATLMSPAAMALKTSIANDPLGFAGNVMLSLKDFERISNYEIYDSRIFSPDLSTSILIVSPKYGTGETGKNETLISELEIISSEMEKLYPSLQVQFFGGPSVAVYNARQVKKDTYLTLGIALLIIVSFISLIFRSKKIIPLLLLPVLYGAVFALAAIYFIKDNISLIAIGVGSVVLGIALSYSIHVITHYSHVKSCRQLVEELSYPLVVGGFTTIAAFLSLLFTSSAMLRDFGLFSALALVGTTLFCLLFLPHLLNGKNNLKTTRKVLNTVEKIASYPYEKNKILWAVVLTLFVAGLFTAQHVEFDNDMSNLNYEPAHVRESEQKMKRLFAQSDQQQIMFVSIGKTPESLMRNYAENSRQLEKLKSEGKINHFISIDKFILSPSEQHKRIEKWKHYWTSEKKLQVENNLMESASKYGFSSEAFQPFKALLNRPYNPYTEGELIQAIPFLADWIISGNDFLMGVSQVQLSDNQKNYVYGVMTEDVDLVIFDRGFFTNKWVLAINHDFNTILFLSSIIIFLALLVSYGRLELALMAFAPMTVSWVIILGLMAVLGIEFNIVNIILATFIFGLGDDYSIFMMDGVQQEYRAGKKMVNAHKIAIFFSAFTAFVGMGVMIFAKHPALKSIAVVSILGLLSVLVVSYMVIPWLFRLFVANPARRGNYPYTIIHFLNTTITYLIFVAGSLILLVVRAFMFLIPVSKKRKQSFFSKLVMFSCRFLIRISSMNKFELLNLHRENFEKPAVIVANHQSMIDILVLLSLYPKLLMVTNKWVWNSPVFGHVVRYAGFIPSMVGFDKMKETIEAKVADGYSVVVFPEGTRSANGKIKRFHKGAFALARQLALDVIPVAIYGAGLILNKRQMYYLKPGTLVVSILRRISPEEASEYLSEQQFAKSAGNIVRSEYGRLEEKFSRPANKYFRHCLNANYIYKGPIEEWYVRVKAAMENYYEYFESIIPRNASVVDVGCGYGMLCYMLVNTSAERNVIGVDYDEDKIAVGNHNFSKTDKLQFRHTDALNFDYPTADVFVVSDMLHYIDFASQELLLEKCVEKLNPEGMIIVRDSNSERTSKHKTTRFTEILSTRIFKFNKTEQKLQFPSASRFEDFAKNHDLLFETKSNDKYTSNQIFIFRKKQRFNDESKI